MRPPLNPPPPEQRRQIYAVARQLHMSIADEYGRPRMELRGENCALPEASWTADQIVLWRISDALNPSMQLDATVLERVLLKTVQINPPSTTLKLLVRCNLALSVHSRLHQTGRIVSHTIFTQVLRLIDEIDDLAWDLVDGHVPWWYSLTVPFQALRTLLAMDT
ncbi:hypothetical protein BO71DRAFT_19832 [Aspergillus ellipticus CBS 707.79]|uniref:Uncharacterized protein n=1 Tax=Aspergillus ellipticus CBS 707.79 TaxID=1448320 RepID=A0A319DMZ8_9EURO|nr:hypothetical protein BO71DRAFT_19832 [Aspergillus ellipticus CBS 707.79]